jgi:hypothetical protein
MPIDFTSPAGRVRLLLNDVDETNQVFTDAEITAFLALEGDNVKRAAAQAIDTNADNEALASKVLRSQDLTTDGAKIADTLRRRAAALRAQADREDADTDDGAVVEFFDMNPTGSGVELASWWP